MSVVVCYVCMVVDVGEVEESYCDSEDLCLFFGNLLFSIWGCFFGIFYFRRSFLIRRGVVFFRFGWGLFCVFVFFGGGE